MRDLTLVVPNLFGPLPDVGVLPVPNALLTLLARSDARDAVGTTAENLLLHLFGIATADEHDQPIAALSWLDEDDGIAEGYWLRADPVHLRADQTRLLLFGPKALDVLMDEAKLLAAQFNAHYAAEGWRLATPDPQRWYLRLATDPKIQTHALSAVIGHNIDSFLPQGEQGKRWHVVLNEVQMLFHSNAVNQVREAQGQLEINSVWFWGGGYLPDVEPTAWSAVCSDAPLARGLARAAGVLYGSLPDDVSAWLRVEGESRLAVLNALQEPSLYGDVDAWCAALTTLERDWFGPVLAALKSGQLDRLTLYAIDGRVRVVSRANLRRFWRRRKDLGGYLQKLFREEFCRGGSQTRMALT